MVRSEIAQLILRYRSAVASSVSSGSGLPMATSGRAVDVSAGARGDSRRGDTLSPPELPPLDGAADAVVALLLLLAAVTGVGA